MRHGAGADHAHTAVGGVLLDARAVPARRRPAAGWRRPGRRPRRPAGPARGSPESCRPSRRRSSSSSPSSCRNRWRSWDRPNSSMSAPLGVCSTRRLGHAEPLHLLGHLDRTRRQPGRRRAGTAAHRPARSIGPNPGVMHPIDPPPTPPWPGRRAPTGRPVRGPASTRRPGTAHGAATRTAPRPSAKVRRGSTLKRRAAPPAAQVLGGGLERGGDAAPQGRHGGAAQRRVRPAAACVLGREDPRGGADPRLAEHPLGGAGPSRGAHQRGHGALLPVARAGHDEDRSRHDGGG